MGLLSYVRMVLWSFFGIRHGASSSAELARARPHVIAITAVTLTALFGWGLWAMAGLAVRLLG